MNTELHGIFERERERRMDLRSPETNGERERARGKNERRNEPP
jgi:hypothetical protein